ncbi:hypothetical protein Phpb_03687 [Photorhabdus namnaonensis]|uniref:Uncharacterized protein n=1 Tax=Photorhabdus namnaonensis TaxID=1851568 RepID=A0A1B8YDJ1_9GAMM|nr:hypothetical protein Phpb_03687 [Photorhabdus namnaonensis]
MVNAITESINCSCLSGLCDYFIPVNHFVRKCRCQIYCSLNLSGLTTEALLGWGFNDVADIHGYWAALPV